MKIWLSCGILLASQIEPLCAQISSDGSLPTSSQVIRNQQQILIDGGTQKGSNLFHSFERFSVRSGEVLLFNNASSIANIFSRVTGRVPSEINGIISANGTANLFLLNPNGIVFGPNATIAIGGSFFASTADAVLFSDGSRFSSTSPTESILTINVPIGLDISASSGSIQVNDTGHQFYVTDPIFSPVTRDSLTPTGLFVQPGKTLGLFGNGLTFDGGQVWAISGRVELGSITQGKVYWDGQGNFNYQNVLKFGDISLANRSSIDASGIQGGMLHLQGKNITLSGGSVVLIQNLSGERSGNIKIHADTLNVLGMNTDATFRSSISNESFAGVGGDVDIVARQINVLEGGSISTKAYQFARGGNINLDISDSILIDNYSQLNPTFFSFIAAGTFSEGRGGNVTVNAPTIGLYNAGLMGTVAFWKGNGGDLTVHAEEVTVNGASTVLPNFSTLIASTASFGDAGSILLNLETLNIENGAGIVSATAAQGNAGSITINSAKIIKLQSFAPIWGNLSRISATSSPEVASLRDLFRLSSSSEGNSGEITINANIIISEFGVITSASLSNGGNIFINSKVLQLTNSFIGSSGSSNLFIRGSESTVAEIISPEYRVDDTSLLQGSGGSIFINSDKINLSNSAIKVRSITSGDGGNLSINTQQLLLLNNSAIEATAFQGDGGNISINTPFLFQSLNSSITASSQLGIDGTINVDTTPYNFDVVTFEIPTQLSPSQVALKSCYDYGQRLTQTGQGQTQRDSNRAGQQYTFDDLIPIGQVVSMERLPDGRVRLLTCQDILKSKLPQN